MSLRKLDFLARGTTASVARRAGAGDRSAALAHGIDGLWLAVVVGVLVTSSRPSASRSAAWCSVLDGVLIGAGDGMTERL